MKKNINSGRAFTIVELLVVISIIAILLALLAPALGGVIRRSKKFTETNALRNVGQAWILYANSNAEYVLPGYLEPEMQGTNPGGWDVQYEYPYVPDPTNPNNPPNVIIDPDIAATWTWRLMPYLSYNHDMIHDHTDEPDRSSMNILEEAEAIALEPGFGYNAFYVGGWWKEYDVVGQDQKIVRYRFWQAAADLDGDDNIDDDERAKVVVRSIGQCRRSTEVVVFCSSSKVEPGVYKKWEDDQPGSHYVVPPYLAQEQHWGRAGGGSGGIGGSGGGDTTFSAAAGDFWTVEAFLQTSVPIGRYTKSSNLLYFDGHTANQAVGVLLDMRNWIDIATTRDFRHNE